MRSLGFTLILALLAVFVCGLAGWQFRVGHFDTIFGAPPVPVGERLFSDFEASEVKFMRISQPGLLQHFELRPDGAWYGTTTWNDRMDPQSAAAILRFALTLRVEDYALADDVNFQKAGFNESGILIRLADGDHHALATFKVGSQTPWLATIEELDAPVPTVFIQPRARGERSYVYACTGDITPLFRDGFKFLRDYHPFSFNPNQLQEIRIRSEQGELTLSRATPADPWRLTKPMELRTSVTAMKALLEGLMKLHAVKLDDQEAVTLPTSSAAAHSNTIALTEFGGEPVMLDIFPPDPAGADEAMATVSDRPETVFTIPLKPTPNLVSLADLPLTVNELRDPSLANLDVSKLRSVRIQPSTSPEILISRDAPKPWMVTIGDHTEEANEERLFAMLKLVKEGQATGFETDAATDFSPWGLDRPFLKLEFAGEAAGQEITLTLAFGVDPEGNYFVNRVGTPTVMKVDPLLVASLPVRTYEWRNARLWALDRTLLTTIRRKRDAEVPLTLLYNFATEEWKASSGIADVTPRLSSPRANYLLGALEGLKVTRWVSPDDDAALTALQNPSLIFLVVEKTLDDEGEETGIRDRTVFIAPAGTSSVTGFYYGRLGDDPQPFLLDRETYQKLATDVLESE